MKEEKRLAKNNRIREKGKETRLRRQSQICRVFRVKIDFSHLNEFEKTQLKMIFVEAKWLYNDVLTFSNSNEINEYDYKITTVHGLDKDKQPVIRELEYLSSQMKQSVIQGIKHNIKSLSVMKKHGRKIGSLKYKSNYESINLQQYGNTYKFCDKKHVKIQGIKRPIKIEGAEQFFDISGIEFANAKLLNLPDGYYVAVTTFQHKGGGTKKYKPEIGIDMGIKTSITTSEGKKIKVFVGETKRLKKIQRRIAKRKKGSSNRYKMRKLLRKEYQKLDNRKKDKANKIVNELLKHEKVYMQDENLSGWQKGFFGKTVQHSALGIVKAKLIKHERVVVLPKNIATTKTCPKCGKINKDITLSDRIFECQCGYKEDRDIHAAKNMILLSKNTCGTQGIFYPNAFGEDVRREHKQKCCNADLDELGSPNSYERG
ncbi:MAG: transposase [Synergistaceae bacterium]|nr:transposase [Synergistaceae bacterium]